MKKLIGLMGIAALLALTGCALEQDGSGDESNIAKSAADLTSSQKLMGAWKATDGTLLGAVFAKHGTKNVFVGDQQVWCIKAPCRPEHLDGGWHVSGKKLTLIENGNDLVYEFAVTSTTLTLSDPSSHKAVGHLAKVTTWCGETSDCSLQSWIKPMCAPSGDVCEASQTCSTHCGQNVPAGYGDPCGASIGKACATGLVCSDLPAKGVLGGTGTCWPGCDVNVAQSCGASLVCAVIGVDTSCEAPGHGQVVGKGYTCGASIGVSCANGLTCTGLPQSGTIGGTGTCS